MKRSIYAGLVVGVLGAGLASADIKVNDNLSLKGFLDMSTGVMLPDAGPMAAWASFDQFETDFLFKYGEHITAEADIAQGGLGGGAGTVALESGFITYTDGGTSITTGRFLSVSGWEAAEPTALYQYSVNEAIGAYGVYQNGVNVAYKAEKYALYGSLVSSVWGGGGDIDIKRFGGEAQLALMPTKEITVKVTALGEQMPGYIRDEVNAWGAYSMGPLVAAVEGTYLMNYSAEDDNGFGGLVMANYKFTPKVAATARFSMLKTDAMADAAQEVTISPSYSIADNWWVLAEARYELEAKSTTLAAETTFTF